jgi:hypothetical protein
MYLKRCNRVNNRYVLNKIFYTIYTLQKTVFALQMFETGGQRNHRSLALIIPAAVVREFGLSPETILALRVDQVSKKMSLEALTTTQGETVSESV